MVIALFDSTYRDRSECAGGWSVRPLDSIGEGNNPVKREAFFGYTYSA